MPCDPSPVSISYLVIKPYEWASGRPLGKENGLPVQTMRWLAIAVWPLDYGQIREPEPWRDDFVRLSHPRRCPDQLASERQQSAPVIWVKPVEQRIASTAQWLNAGTVQGTLAANGPDLERDQRPIHIEEDEGTVGSAGHHARTSPNDESFAAS
jgi:hypothetical protein